MSLLLIAPAIARTRLRGAIDAKEGFTAAGLALGNTEVSLSAVINDTSPWSREHSVKLASLSTLVLRLISAPSMLPTSPFDSGFTILPAVLFATLLTPRRALLAAVCVGVLTTSATFLATLVLVVVAPPAGALLIGETSDCGAFLLAADLTVNCVVKPEASMPLPTYLADTAAIMAAEACSLGLNSGNTSRSNFSLDILSGAPQRYTCWNFEDIWPQNVVNAINSISTLLGANASGAAGSLSGVVVADVAALSSSISSRVRNHDSRG